MVFTSKEIKFLGMMFKSDFNWSVHINMLTKNYNNSFRILAFKRYLVGLDFSYYYTKSWLDLDYEDMLL